MSEKWVTNQIRSRTIWVFGITRMGRVTEVVLLVRVSEIVRGFMEMEEVQMV